MAKLRKPPRRTYDLAFTGELAGFHVTMGAMSGADIIGIRSGDLSEVDTINLIKNRMVEHDFDVDDVLNLDYWVLVEIMRVWGVAMEEAAVPPVIGEP